MKQEPTLTEDMIFVLWILIGAICFVTWTICI